MQPALRTETLPGRLPAATAWPAGEPDLRVSFVTLSSGEQVRVVEAGPVDGRPVTLLHGWGCSGYVYRRNLPGLAAAGFRAIVPDLRGHGFSSKPHDERLYTLDALTDFVVALLDALAVDRTVLVGHSMSGAIAERVAERHPERVAALALLAPVGLGPIHWGPLPWITVARLCTPAWLTPLLPHTVGRSAIALILTLAYGGRNRFDRHDVDEYWAPTQFPGYSYAARTLLHRFDWRTADDERWRRLRMPTLVAIGTRDRFVDPAGLDRVRRAAPRIAASLVTGAGHILPEERADLVTPLLVSLAQRVEIDQATG